MLGYSIFNSMFYFSKLVTIKKVSRILFKFYKKEISMKTLWKTVILQDNKQGKKANIVYQNDLVCCF